jgi:diaminohydroxyphosphoribosylaminopyrimidine deaminase/5-amino-6-(5-phosphoribosylamino)uracil reductase
MDLSRMIPASVSPNPRVGSVVVLGEKITGEGLHWKYGHQHAEVNAIENALRRISHLSGQSIYVSLEPCSHHGKTPPCSERIIKEGINKVLIGKKDSNPLVGGSGIDLLERAGIKVEIDQISDVDDPARHFNYFHKTGKPYIILKYASSADGYIGKQGEEIAISNRYSKRLVHKWRSEVDAILVGRKTAFSDDPQLNNRHYFGSSPKRFIIDLDNKLSEDNVALLAEEECYRFTKTTARKDDLAIDAGEDILDKMLEYFSHLNIHSVLIEGGAFTIEQFIKKGHWNEARLILSDRILGTGIKAPNLNMKADYQERISNDLIHWYFNPDA